MPPLGFNPLGVSKDRAPLSPHPLTFRAHGAGLDHEAIAVLAPECRASSIEHFNSVMSRSAVSYTARSDGSHNLGASVEGVGLSEGGPCIRMSSMPTELTTIIVHLDLESIDCIWCVYMLRAHAM